MTPALKWQIGEELVYSVKWSFVTLGQLKLQVLSSDSVDKNKVYHCRIYIDSNPSIPFVDIHDIYDSYIDADEIYSHIFISYEQKDDYLLYTKYDFNYHRKQVAIFIERRTDHTNETLLDSVVTIPGKVQDSLSLLFFARAMVKNWVSLEIPVFAYNQLDTTQINFTGNKVNYESNDQELKGFFLDGRLKFVGIAGVKEDFKGWFSLDNQKVPIKAYMKAFVGSVKLELDEWKHWNGEKYFTEIEK